MITFLFMIGDALSPFILYLKIFKNLGIFSWMAGLFYLPRIFVYHRESDDENVKKTLDVMGYKLYRIIIMPAMHVSVIFGLLLWLLPKNRGVPWMYLKFICIGGLIVFQFYLNACRKKLAARLPYKSGLYFRYLNEIPTVLLIFILIFALFKPFS